LEFSFFIFIEDIYKVNKFVIVAVIYLLLIMVDTIIINKLITNILLCLAANFNNSVFCLLVFVQLYSIILFCHDATPLVGQGLLIVEDTRSHTVRHTTLGRTPLDE